MYTIVPGVPTSYPTDAMQCAIDCAKGICTDPPECRLWANHVAASYAAVQAVAVGPCPPCPGPCSVAEFEAAHAALKSGKKAAGTFNWLALMQLILANVGPIIQDLLNLLNPPTPAPTKKP